MCQYDVAIIIEQLRKKTGVRDPQKRGFSNSPEICNLYCFYVLTLHVSLGLSVVHPPVCPDCFTVKFTPATLKRVACYQFCCLVDRGTMDVNSLPIDLNSCSIYSNRKLDLYDINPEQPDLSWRDLALKDQMSR